MAKRAAQELREFKMAPPVIACQGNDITQDGIAGRVQKNRSLSPNSPGLNGTVGLASGCNASRKRHNRLRQPREPGLLLPTPTRINQLQYLRPCRIGNGSVNNITPAIIVPPGVLHEVTLGADEGFFALRHCIQHEFLLQ